ncbi:MAG: transporter substrate-binding domain-containing protein [Reichenbachiella sp.]
MKNIKIKSTFLLAILWTSFLIGCKNGTSSENTDDDQSIARPETADIDLDSIINRGYLVAIFDNSLNSMFLYRGQPMGFEYELVSNFASSLGVELKFKMTRSLDEGFEMLNNGMGDILAYNLTVTQKRKNIIGFTDPQHLVSQVLIQRKPKEWRKMKLHEIDRKLIKNPIDMADITVHVRKASAYASRLRNLADEIGGDIRVIEMEDMETEEIIEMVASGEIEYTVADDNIAKLHARFYPLLDVSTAVSLPQQIAWGVRNNSTSLTEKINEWQAQMKRTADFNDLYNKYFRNSRVPRDFINSEFLSKDGNTISPYDSLIKQYAKTIDWDWKLLAAQISKESKFNPDAKSWVGARGLMQVMPKTAKEYGIKKLTDPNQNIKAGTIHLKWLEDRWVHLSDSSEKLKFVLGSYNVGHGHVWDAVRLTEKYGGNSHSWEEVSKYLRLKSKEKYFKDPVVQYGFCRGDEPADYVIDILYRYDRYLQLNNVEL